MYLNNCGRVRKICYVTRGKQIPETWVRQCRETFPKGFMVVGCLTGRDALPLIKVPSKCKINSKYYIDFLLKLIFERKLPNLYLILVKSPDISLLDFFGFGWLKREVNYRKPITSKGL